jgi:hypothetical protein
MSCYYDNEAKIEIKNFLQKLNTLLREEGFSIDFINGTLNHNYKGFCGALDDEKSSLCLLDDNTGLVLYETDKYKNNDQ